MVAFTRPYVLAVVAMLLATMVGAEATWPQDVELAAPPVPLPVQAPAALEAPSTDHTALTAVVVARPLFDPKRRPGTPAVTASALAPHPPRLTGTIIGTGQRRAILADLDNAPREVTVAEGGQVGPWTVQAVGPGRVTLSGPGGPHWLQLGRSLPHPPLAPKAVPSAEPGIWSSPCGRGTATLNGC